MALVVVLAILGTRGVASSPDPYRVHVVQTSATLAQRMSALPNLEFGRRSVTGEPVIRVNAGVRYQTVAGFGAAMTDSSAWLIERKLLTGARQSVMADLFGPAGIHLNFVRVPIGASDFTSTGRPYSYDDVPAGQTDPGLTHFSIAHDAAYVLPALRQARALNPAATFLATPWSPPAWMKANDSLSNAHGRGTLLPADYRVWAAYVVRFIQAYRRAGIPIDALTPQNEPGVATLYPGLNLTPAEEATWVVRYLKPALAQAHLHPRLYGVDRGWGPTTAYADATARGPEAAGLAGLAWHCYFGTARSMTALRMINPALMPIVDECSPGLTPTPISDVVISSLRNWASTVALWNLALDPTGGPAQPPNHGCPGCSGLVTIDPATGTVTPTLSYYQLGQASAFITPGARRIASSTFVSYRYPGPGVNDTTPGLDDVAVRNRDGGIVLIAYNNAPRTVRFAVAWKGRAFRYQLAPGATATFTWNQP